ncbi:hypothetical protein C8J57DRAFT_1633737 [Mycena rebaudengoi]|nr:hypothetical protein C8J57DRAFT_1633737 [Mycena rebaudengoi]
MNSSETFGNINKMPPTVRISSETQGNHRTYLWKASVYLQQDAADGSNIQRDARKPPNLFMEGLCISPTRRRRRFEYPARRKETSEPIYGRPLSISNKTPPTVRISSETQGNHRTYLWKASVYLQQDAADGSNIQRDARKPPNLFMEGLCISPTRRRRRFEYPARRKETSEPIYGRPLSISNKTPPTVRISSETQGNQRAYLWRALVYLQQDAADDDPRESQFEKYHGRAAGSLASFRTSEADLLAVVDEKNVQENQYIINRAPGAYGVTRDSLGLYLAKINYEHDHDYQSDGQFYRADCNLHVLPVSLRDFDPERLKGLLDWSLQVKIFQDLENAAVAAASASPTQVSKVLASFYFLRCYIRKFGVEFDAERRVIGCEHVRAPATNVKKITGLKRGAGEYTRYWIKLWTLNSPSSAIG